MTALLKRFFLISLKCILFILQIILILFFQVQPWAIVAVCCLLIPQQMFAVAVGGFCNMCCNKSATAAGKSRDDAPSGEENLVKGRVTNSAALAKAKEGQCQVPRSNNNSSNRNNMQQPLQLKLQMQTRAALNTINFLFQPGRICWWTACLAGWPSWWPTAKWRLLRPAPTLPLC